MQISVIYSKYLMRVCMRKYMHFYYIFVKPINLRSYGKNKTYKSKKY